MNGSGQFSAYGSSNEVWVLLLNCRRFQTIFSHRTTKGSTNSKVWPRGECMRFRGLISLLRLGGVSLSLSKNHRSLLFGFHDFVWFVLFVAGLGHPSTIFSRSVKNWSHRPNRTDIIHTSRPQSQRIILN